MLRGAAAGGQTSIVALRNLPRQAKRAVMIVIIAFQCGAEFGTIQSFCPGV